ncbi:YmdB family metallophosphoesterase, partial [Mesorhizobium sp.]|uniref:YmdB family metallophosphoesterase n=1 Tax=Mesorhizobium sp. TaxID=1871066 RepID=UPI0025ED700C
MRLLFLGDMVGKTGRTAVWEQLPGLISDFKLDFVIVNGENAAVRPVFPTMSPRKRSLI